MQNGKLNWAYTGWIYYKGSYQYIVKGVLHEHSWEAETKTVHHEAEINYEPYEVAVCTGCGAEFASVEELAEHATSAVLQGDLSHGSGGSATKYKEIIITPEYDEEIISYRCSVCGAYKNAEQ